jgi:hypothetical protein
MPARSSLVAIGEGDDFCAAKPVLLGCFGCAADSEQENVRLHDPLEAVSANPLNDMKQPSPVNNFGRLFDEETGIKVSGHGLALSANATPDNDVSFIAAALTTPSEP